jgi:hypothetical protein
MTSIAVGHSHIFVIQDPNPLVTAGKAWTNVKRLYD